MLEYGISGGDNVTGLFQEETIKRNWYLNKGINSTTPQILYLKYLSSIFKVVIIIIKRV